MSMLATWGGLFVTPLLSPVRTLGQTCSSMHPLSVYKSKLRLSVLQKSWIKSTKIPNSRLSKEVLVVPQFCREVIEALFGVPVYLQQ